MGIVRLGYGQGQKPMTGGEGNIHRRGGPGTGQCSEKSRYWPTASGVRSSHTVSAALSPQD